MYVSMYVPICLSIYLCMCIYSITHYIYHISIIYLSYIYHIWSIIYDLSYMIYHTWSIIYDLSYMILHKRASSNENYGNDTFRQTKSAFVPMAGSFDVGANLPIYWLLLWCSPLNKELKHFPPFLPHGACLTFVFSFFWFCSILVCLLKFLVGCCWASCVFRFRYSPTVCANALLMHMIYLYNYTCIYHFITHKQLSHTHVYILYIICISTSKKWTRNSAVLRRCLGSHMFSKLLLRYQAASESFNFSLKKKGYPQVPRILIKISPYKYGNIGVTTCNYYIYIYWLSLKFTTNMIKLHQPPLGQSAPFTEHVSDHSNRLHLVGCFLNGASDDLNGIENSSPNPPGTTWNK